MRVSQGVLNGDSVASDNAGVPGAMSQVPCSGAMLGHARPCSTTGIRMETHWFQTMRVSQRMWIGGFGVRRARGFVLPAQLVVTDRAIWPSTTPCERSQRPAIEWRHVGSRVLRGVPGCSASKSCLLLESTGKECISIDNEVPQSTPPSSKTCGMQGVDVVDVPVGLVWS